MDRGVEQPRSRADLVTLLRRLRNVLSVYYKGVGGRIAAEVFFFGQNQKVERAAAHYDA
jgi:hypothetical protein